MASKIERVHELVDEIATEARAKTVKDIMADLMDSTKSGRMDGEADTWEGGMRAALEVIGENYPLAV